MASFGCCSLRSFAVSTGRDICRCPSKVPAANAAGLRQGKIDVHPHHRPVRDAADTRGRLPPRRRGNRPGASGVGTVGCSRCRTGRGRSAVPDGVFVVPRGRRDKERGRVHGWLGKAARQSHTEAKYRHGGMLSEKATTPAQIEEATSWLESAAAQGNDNASLLLAKWLRAAGPQQDRSEEN